MIRRWLGEPDSVRRRYGGGEFFLYEEARVDRAEADPAWQEARQKWDRRKNMPVSTKTVDLLAAIYAVNRSAKRYREQARTCYSKRKHGFASQAKEQKELLYRLKDNGIATAYLEGRIHSVGLLAEGMVEYRGEGYCFHSTLLPQAVDLAKQEGSEPLRVEAKPCETKEPSLKDAIYTLQQLPQVPHKFVRLEPEWQRQQEKERARKRALHEQPKQRWKNENEADEDVDEADSE